MYSLTKSHWCPKWWCQLVCWWFDMDWSSTCLRILSTTCKQGNT